MVKRSHMAVPLNLFAYFCDLKKKKKKGCCSCSGAALNSEESNGNHTPRGVNTASNVPMENM